jgi:hypothetical protein
VRAAWAAAGIGFLAAAEMLLGMGATPFWFAARADAAMLVQVRPWLLVAGAALVSGWPWRWRLAAYGAGLIAAASNQAAFLASLGNPDPLPEVLRIAAGSALLLLVVDPVLRLAGRRLGRLAAAGAALALALLCLLPAVLRPYSALVRGPADGREAAHKPEVVLMTAMPLIWGEGGAFDPESRPAAAYLALQEEFTVRPVDTLGRDSLASARLLLLAQPRWLSPSELVALDRWVREGGAALVLADPSLHWPSELPLGDIRRPPAVSLLKPLLDHWGLELRQGAGSEGGLVARERRLRLHEPGRFAATAQDCRVVRPFEARCRIGRGRAILLADADLFHDGLWIGPGPDGGAAHRRISDNPLVVADLLDELAGIERQRVRAPVRWRRSDEPPMTALARAVLPPAALALAGLAAALLLGRRRGGKPQTYPQN